MPKVQITKEAIEKSLQDGAKNMSEIYRALGGTSKVSGSFSKAMRETLPSVDARLKENQGQPVQTTEKSCVPDNQTTQTPALEKPKPAPKKPTQKPAKPTKRTIGLPEDFQSI